MIKVFIIDDSMFIRNILSKILKNKSNIKIVGEASNPIDAMNEFKNIGLPDVIILDLEMPKMDGFTFLRKMREERLIPTIVLASLSDKKSKKALEVLELGAKDVIPKPSILNEFNNDTFISQLVLSIQTIALETVYKESTYEKVSSNKIIAIGASTGGVQTLEKILSKLKPFHAPIVIAQHMPKGFTTSFANRLNKICINSEIKEAQSNQIAELGDVFIAPGNYHLEIEKTNNNKFKIILKDYPKVSNHKPSVDVLFKSIAIQAKENAIAFILTGMGKDGALGIKKIKESGGKTYGQDEKSSIVYGMPKVAYETGGLTRQVSINEVIDIINNIK